MAFEEEKSNPLSLENKEREGNHMESSGFTFFSFYLHDNPSHATHGPRHMGNPDPPQKNVSSNFKTKKFQEDYIF